MYVLHPTVPLKVVYRNAMSGSQFINTLISVYGESAHNTSILDLQTLVTFQNLFKLIQTILCLINSLFTFYIYQIHKKMKEHFENLKETQTSCGEDRGLHKKL